MPRLDLGGIIFFYFPHQVCLVSKIRCLVVTPYISTWSLNANVRGMGEMTTWAEEIFSHCLILICRSEPVFMKVY
jgi:hypothetical protein